MRIRLLKIKEYKNLKGLSLQFIDENIDVLIGNNGSGKTNIYEFILKVFQKVSHKDKRFSYEFILDYEISINGRASIVSLHGDGEKINVLIDGHKPNYTTKHTVYTPQKILVYYSGSSSKLQSIYSEHILHIQDEHFPLIFMSLLSSSLTRNQEFLEEFFHIDLTKEVSIDVKIKNFFTIEEYLDTSIIREIEEEKLLNIRKIEEDVTLNLENVSTSDYLNMYLSEIRNLLNTEPTYQKRMRLDFLQSLLRHSKDIELSSDKKYFIVNLKPNLESYDDIQEYDIEFFSRLFDVYRGRYIKVEDILFSHKNIESQISYKDLSEGETQFILAQGIVELFGDDENLLLFDEADTYLHPTWQRKIIGNLRESKSDIIHILFTTHSPQTLTSVTRKNIYIIQKDIESGVTNIFNPPRSIFGRDINSIVSEAMGIPERPEEIERLFNEYFKLISQFKLDEANFTKLKILEITKNEENFINDELDFIKANVIIEQMKLLRK